MPRPSQAAAWVDVVEATYDTAAAPDAWLSQVLATLHPLLPASIMLHGFAYDLSGDAEMKLDPLVFHHIPDGVPPAMADAGTRGSQAALPRADALRAFGVLRAATATELLGRQTDKKLELAERGGPFGIRDTLGINAPEPDRRGVAIVASLGAPTRLDARRRGVLVRLASHVAASLRLRRARGGVPLRPEHGEAVLDPRGRVVHAAGIAEARGAREALAEAARRIILSKKLRDASDDDALQAWRALVTGRWSVVATDDVDGRRFYVAVENAPGGPAAERLDARERSVAAMAGLGQSNKMIGYQLGLSSAAVARALTEVQRKLGVRSRTELVALLSALAPPG